MENIIIFVPTGEVRKVYEGEYYKNNGGDITSWKLNNSDNIYPLYTKTEIEIDEEYTRMSYQLHSDKITSDIKIIPFDKPKIKKWKWSLKGIFTTNEYYTEEEMFSWTGVVKIPETEIEG